MKNILVSPCGSEVALELHRALKFSTHFNLIGASSVSDHGRLVFEDYIGDLPFHNQPDFLQRMKNIVVERNIDELGVLITLAVSPEDMGQVIGRQGATAKSIRTLLRVIGAKNNARVNLKINEPEGSERAEPVRIVPGH